jgi:predicted dehydrogenase
MRKLGFGLIGCGDISQKRVAPALRDLDNCELVAVTRAKTELAEESAREFGARRWYKTNEELLNDGEVEAVYIATPHNQHTEQAIASAEAGKHVLCEKPLALNAADARRIIEACAANGVKLGVAYYRHHYPVISRVKDIVGSGEIGKVTMVQINAFESHQFPPGHPRYWTTLKQYAGGGPMMSFGCHRIEVMMSLLGRVTEVASQLANSLYDRDVEDNSAAVLHFENGALGVLSINKVVREPHDTLDVYGSKGSLHVPVLNKGALRVWTPEGERTEEHPPHENIHQPLIEDFAEAVLKDREPVVNGQVGLRVQEVLDQIYG